MFAVVRRIVLAAAASGVLAGLILTGVQMVEVIPLILEAESREAAHTVAGPGDPPHDGGGHAHSRLDPAGLERTAYTALANVTTGFGFALVLCSLYAVQGGVTTRQGVLWGLAGFAVFFVGPALGLPPELPGTAAAALVDRQLWWLLAVACTAGGLALLTFRAEGVAALGGGTLLLVPHLVGAPRPAAGGLDAPTGLAHDFLAASLVANGIYWLMLGILSAFAFRAGRADAG